ncbi:MAG: cell division protein ZapA [Candidatus Aminicenantia bacterium]
MESSINIEILGESLQIISLRTREELRELISYIDDKKREIEKIYPSLEPMKIAILIMLHISDELFTYRKWLHIIQEKVEEIEFGLEEEIKRLT